MSSGFQKIPMSGGSAALVALGAAAVAGLITAASTHTDGTRNVSRERDGDYQLRPTSQDAARASISHQRVFAGLGIAGGAAVLGFQALTGPGLAGTLLGALLLGAGAGSMIKLSGAEDKIDPSLPQHTPEGASDMTRHNKYQYQQEGAGYSANGMYQGPRWGQAAYSPTYQQNWLDQQMPTIPNQLHMSTYFGGNVRPDGPFGLGMPTGIEDVNALGRANAQQWQREQQALAAFRAGAGDAPGAG